MAAPDTDDSEPTSVKTPDATRDIGSQQRRDRVHEASELVKPGHLITPAERERPFEGPALDLRNIQAIEGIEAARIHKNRVFVCISVRQSDARGKPIPCPTETWFRTLTIDLHRQPPRYWSFSIGVRQVALDEVRHGRRYITLMSEMLGMIEIDADKRGDEATRLYLMTPSEIHMESKWSLLDLLER